MPSKTLSLPGNAHFHGVLIVLLVLASFNWFVWPILAVYVGVLPRSMRKFILLYAAILLLPPPKEMPTTCEVRSQTEFASVCVNRATVRLNRSFPVGSVLTLQTVPRPPSPAVLAGFQRERYYRSQGIDFDVIDQGSFVTETTVTVFQLQSLFLTYLSRYDQPSQAYLRALLAGDRSQLEASFVDNIAGLGILHLFAISGLHIGLIVALLESFLRRVVNNPHPFIAGFLITYFFVTGFATSVVRAGLMWMVYRFGKPYGLQPLDAISIAASIVLLHNRYAIFDVGFQLSYLVSLGLLVVPIQGNKATQLWRVSWIAQIVTLPIQANMSRSINVMAPMINVVFVWFVSVVVLPLSLVELVFSNPLYPEVLTLFESLIAVANAVQWQVALPFVSPPMMILFYWILFVQQQKKWLILWGLGVLLWPSSERIVYLDVGQGDSVLMQLPQCTLLLDTGGQLYRNVARQVLYPHFHALGVRHLDFLVLTHADFDHVGAAYDVIGTLSIGTLVLPAHSQHPRNVELAQLASQHRIPVRYVQQGDRLCGNIEVLGPTGPTPKSNDESIVLLVPFAHQRWFFMGDNEQMIGTKADVYMLGHHGSKTSTNADNLARIDPRVGVISVGRNHYGLPSPEVLRLVEDLTVYRTDRDGSIVYSALHDRFFTTQEYRRWFYGEWRH